MNTESQEQGETPPSQRIEQSFIPPPTGAQLAWQETVREQQEWTPEWLANYGKADNWLESICDAHNAALAAERQQLLSAQAAIEALCKLWESSDERDSPKKIQSEIDKIRKFDLSALHQHDAEVRKPLVEALKQVYNWALWITEPELQNEDKRAAKIAGIIDDALAQAKEGK